MDWLVSQALYHGLAQAGEEGILLCWPRTPYACLGCHEPFEDWHPQSGIPVLRRQVGGTLVLLDAHQLFYQLIASPTRMARGGRPAQWYQWALKPVVHYLETLGYQAEMRLPADILADGRKISGNAGGQVGQGVVVVGNLLVDFDVDRMAEVRALPHPAIRAAYADSMRRHLATLNARHPMLTVEEAMEGLLESYLRAGYGVAQEPPWHRWQPILQRAAMRLASVHWTQAVRAPGPTPVKVREGVYLECALDASGAPRIREVFQISSSMT